MKELNLGSEATVVNVIYDFNQRDFSEKIFHISRDSEAVWEEIFAVLDETVY